MPALVGPNNMPLLSSPKNNTPFLGPKIMPALVGPNNMPLLADADTSASVGRVMMDPAGDADDMVSVNKQWSILNGRKEIAENHAFLMCAS